MLVLPILDVSLNPAATAHAFSRQNALHSGPVRTQAQWKGNDDRIVARRHIVAKGTCIELVVRDRRRGHPT